MLVKHPNLRGRCAVALNNQSKVKVMLSHAGTSGVFAGRQKTAFMKVSTNSCSVGYLVIIFEPNPFTIRAGWERRTAHCVATCASPFNKE